MRINKIVLSGMIIILLAIFLQTIEWYSIYSEIVSFLLGLGGILVCILGTMMKNDTKREKKDA